MNIQYSFKKMPFSLNLRRHIEEKCQRLTRYFSNTEISLHWTLETDNLEKIAQCRLLGRQMDYFGEARTENFMASIDEVVERIEVQLRRRKEIVKDHLHRRRSSDRAIQIKKAS